MKSKLLNSYIFLNALLLLVALGFVFSFNSYAQDKKNSNKESERMFEINFKVEKYQLENGLTVLLHKEAKAPLVNYQTWYRVGGQDDPHNQTGIAHLFEHLTFRETSKRDGKDFLKEVESKGIGYNAYTSFDQTVYYFNLPSQELEFIAELEAERMADVVINAKNLKLEQEIVKEERLLRVENNPQNIWIDLFETVFVKNKYRQPVIGYKKDINSITVQNCLDFYNTFYSPNNAILVITGPIDISKTKKIIEKYYGHLKPALLPQRDYPLEPQQSKARVERLIRAVQAPSLTIAYPTIPIGILDNYALDILSFILGGGKASRLYQPLVESKLALSASSFSYALQNAGMVIFSAELHPQSSLEKVQKIIVNEIQKIAKSNISKEELSRARTNIIKSHVDSLKTAAGKGSLLGFYEMFYGSYDHLFKNLEHYNNVQLSDVQRVAQKYFNSHQQNIIKLDTIK